MPNGVAAARVHTLHGSSVNPVTSSRERAQVQAQHRAGSGVATATLSMRPPAPPSEHPGCQPQVRPAVREHAAARPAAPMAAMVRPAAGPTPLGCRPVAAAAAAAARPVAGLRPQHVPVSGMDVIAQAQRVAPRPAAAAAAGNGTSWAAAAAQPRPAANVAAAPRAVPVPTYEERSYVHKREHDCSICLGFILDDPMACPPCGHMFHHACLLKSVALKPVCPVCEHACKKKDIIRLYLC